MYLLIRKLDVEIPESKNLAARFWRLAHQIYDQRAVSHVRISLIGGRGDPFDFFAV